MNDLRHSTILITRPAEKAEVMADLVRQMEGIPLVCPTIQIAAPVDWAKTDSVIDQIPSYDWLIFSSAHGVEYFCQRIEKVSSIKVLHQVQIAAVGSKTADTLNKIGIDVDLVPAEYTADDLLQSLTALPISGKKVLLITGDKGRPILQRGLENSGVHVDRIVVYRNTAATPKNLPLILQQLQNNGVDFVTFTSPSTFHNFHELLIEETENPQPLLRRPQLVAIGPVTRKAIEGAGYVVTLVPPESTIESMLASIRNHLSEKRHV